MAVRKRMIDPHIWEDPSFNRLSKPARLLFIGMFSQADDYGYIRADAGSLKRLIFGFDDVTTDEIRNWLGEIKKFTNIHLFLVKGEEYAHFLKWSSFQILRPDRLQASVYPKCIICQPPVRQVPAEVKGREEKRSKGKGREENVSSKIEKTKKEIAKILRGKRKVL